jgi:hypothetical protein
VIALLLALAASPETAQEPVYTWRDTLDAIRVVETGGLPREGVGAKGDYRTVDGKRVPMARGPYQVWSVYHFDAAERDKTLDSYAKCLTSKTYSERVVRAYMDRYARAELGRLEKGCGTLADVEVIARIHNGGPRGATTRRKATDPYWRKAKREVTR